MHTIATRLFRARHLAAVAVLLVGVACSAQAAIITYTCTLDGLSEAPPNGSAGIGIAQVDVDNVANTMHVQFNWAGLSGTTTAAHIHAPTAIAMSGTAGVATTTPFFAGFTTGVLAGAYNNTLDMTLASSYNPSYVTANGGTTASAQAALFAAIAAGKAYLNIHTSVVPGGEIRGFLVPGQPTATAPSTWGRIKHLYR